MFAVNIFFLFLGLGFISSGFIVIGIAKQSIFGHTRTKYENEEEKIKILKTARQGIKLFIIGVVITGISFYFIR